MNSETKKPIINTLQEADYFLLVQYYGYSETARSTHGNNLEDIIRNVARARHCCSSCLEYLSTNNPPFTSTFYTMYNAVIEYINEEINFENKNEVDTSRMTTLRDKLFHAVRQF